MLLRLAASVLLPRLRCTRRQAWLRVFGLLLLACAAPPRAGLAAPKPTPAPTVAPTPTPKPTPTPAATPAPAPAQPEAETTPEIAPPLSIYDSSQMAAEAAHRLDEPAPTTATLRQVDRMLNAVILYVDRIDRIHSTLPFYVWEEVSAEKAPRDGWETQVFKLRQPLPQVTALSVRARHGDLELKSLVAIDRNRTHWEFNQAVHVPAEQPRPEIFFLSLPTDLAEIRITCRRSDPQNQRWPRLFIDAGISSVPESAKQAIYYLRVARGDIKARRLPAAGQHIRQACDQLSDYQKNRRF